jgi:hypothetical protein
MCDYYPYGNIFSDFVPQRNKNLLLSNMRLSEDVLYPRCRACRVGATVLDALLQ